MKPVVILLSAAALVTSGGAAAAQPGPPGGHPHGMPPGQAKKVWRSGERIPRAYYTERTYYIVEPTRYQLRAAPAGYRWVLVDGDAYLVRRDTGLVADVVANVVANLVR